MLPFFKYTAPIGLALCVMAGSAGNAHAQSSQISTEASENMDAGADLFSAEEAITDSALQNIAGREDIQQLSTATQTAGVSRNSVGDNSVTGDARIADNAFQNLSGLSILNVNTGNNVAINAALNVNISITPDTIRP